MDKRFKKIYLFACLLFLFSVSLVFAQNGGLEVEYPEVEGLKPENIEFPLTWYVKYIFNFLIWIAGAIALGSLIVGGVIYLTSTGKAERLNKAKKQILAAFWGIIILLASYIILTTINPQLIIFNLPGIPKIQPSELPPTSISPLITADLLGRTKEIAEKIKQLSPEIQNIAGKIQELTEKCDCERTLPLCMCTAGDESGQCQPQRCYAGPPSDPQDPDTNHHPCPDFMEIKENQGKIIVWGDEILYYRNRAVAERGDLRMDIEERINVKIEWYEETIAKQTEQELIDYLNEEKKWLEYERDYKEELIGKLIDLANAIAEVEEPVEKISQLPDECLINVGDTNICKPICKGKCHDLKDGCQPDKCDGDNPCPTDEIQNQVDEINSFPGKIIEICDEIIAIIENIKKTQERTIEI